MIYSLGVLFNNYHGVECLFLGLMLRMYQQNELCVHLLLCQYTFQTVYLCDASY